MKKLLLSLSILVVGVRCKEIKSDKGFFGDSSDYYFSQSHRFLDSVHKYVNSDPYKAAVYWDSGAMYHNLNVNYTNNQENKLIK